MASVLFYPAFTNRASFCDQLFRMVWHFLPMVERLECLLFAYSGSDADSISVDDILRSPQDDLPADFDPAIAEYARRYVGKVKLGSPTQIGYDIADLKGIIVWETSDPKTVTEAQALGQKAGAEVVLVDPNRVQQETLEIIRFAYSLWPQSDLEALVEHSYASFLTHKKKWDGKAISVFGNGPSLGQVVKDKVEPKTELRAVCNSTIGDQAALDHLKPHLLFCGDPVQHCGVSLYAGDFRKSLSDALKDENRVLFTQLGYVPYFREITPSTHHDRIIGIGNDRRAQFNLDLTSEYLTAATANIFTMLVLPVAFTLSKSVDIYGCDGMPFKSATKPWSHAEEDDYMSKMSVTHRVHKGFWQRNYEEEYWAYSQDLVQLLAAAEDAGCNIRVRTPSYVPALGARYESLDT